MSDKISYSCHGDIAILTVQNPPVNALSQPVRQGLWDGMDRAEAEQGIRAIMIVGEGRAFFAGADITEFGKPPLKPHLPDLINRIESSPLLIVASMHGVSLGGGWRSLSGATIELLCQQHVSAFQKYIWAFCLEQVGRSDYPV